MNRRIFERPCRHCKQPFVGNRMLKYCGDECREVVGKTKRLAYERRVKRWPHKYRAKRQMELALDKPETMPYKDVR